MGVTKIAHALAAGLIISGIVISQANAAVVSVTPANNSVVFSPNLITSHTITKNGDAMAAGTYSTDTTAATGRIAGGATNVLAVKWDPACGTISTTTSTQCVVSNGTNQVTFVLTPVSGSFTLVPGTSGIDSWYKDGSTAAMTYLIKVLGNDQIVTAGTYSIIVDAGVDNS